MIQQKEKSHYDYTHTHTNRYTFKKNIPRESTIGMKDEEQVWWFFFFFGFDIKLNQARHTNIHFKVNMQQLMFKQFSLIHLIERDMII